MILLGELMTAPFRRRLAQNDRLPRAWGFSLGWVFVGVVTFPPTTDLALGDLSEKDHKFRTPAQPKEGE